MSVHASSQWAWVQATIETWFAALTITGTPTKSYEATDRQRPAAAWTRITILPVSATVNGPISATVADKAIGRMLQVTIDLFWPNGENAATHAMLDLLKATSDVEDELTGLRLQLNDFTTGSPVAVPGVFLIAQRAARAARVPSTSDGWDRRQVTQTFTWWGQSTAT